MQAENVIREKHAGDIEQLKFIFSDENRIIVTAPAGCGKTTAMVSKIARELSNGHILSNKKILAMTFSVNAAMKIKDSLKALLPELVENIQQYLAKVDVANYHNFAMRILFKHGYCLNGEFTHLSEFKIVDEDSPLLNTFITSADSDKLKKVNDAVKASNKEELIAALDDYWDILNRKLITNHVITYNGILISAIKLLRKTQISSFYKQYYQMIIIDEFQDTNLLGYLLIKKLIGNNMIIFLGDDVQKIYGFLGAVNGIFNLIIESYPAIEIKFCNNYRFRENDRMKDLDLFIRDCVENFQPSHLKASVLVKNLQSDHEEDDFIVKGIEKIVSTKENKVAVLVRAGWQGNSVAQILDQKGIPYFNALFKETDPEYISFYNIALEEFHNNVLGKAVQRNLKNCLLAVDARRNEIYQQESKKYIFESMYKLLEILFVESKKVSGTSRDRYDYIDFILGNKGLKHMMEFVDEQVVLTTIHAAKGLEWEYVIIPRLNGFAFPSSHMCRPCKEANSCNEGFDYCKFTYAQSFKKAFKEELSILYVGITRAKKNAFFTVNTGANKWNHSKTTSCLLNLEGLILEDYEWENVI